MIGTVVSGTAISAIAAAAACDSKKGKKLDSGLKHEYKDFQSFRKTGRFLEDKSEENVALTLL